MLLTAMSSKGAFLLTALPESNCATWLKFWGSKPLFISAFLADCRTHTCPPLQSHHSPSQQPRFCLFSHSGGLFHALGTPSSQKHTFQCAFSLLYIILRFVLEWSACYHCWLMHIKRLQCLSSKDFFATVCPQFHSWLASFKHAEKLGRVASGIQQELDVMFPMASFQHLSKSRLLQKVLK